MNGNKLRKLDPELLSNLSDLNSVELHDNEWMCDCHLRRFVKWLKNTKKLEVSSKTFIFYINYSLYKNFSFEKTN